MSTMGCDADDACDVRGLAIALGVSLWDDDSRAKGEDLLRVTQSCSACLDRQGY
ncbi:hypothetical protein [Nostoc sp.]|uniref:hypothetical protein n=1 Tax=Nostoc sp. TaxID=1180 RepID=UPI002FF804DA